VPPDERQAERRAQVLDAAYELLGTTGLAGTTVRGVCEAARLNPRYFYESFDDLDALLVAVFDRTSSEALAVMLDAVAAAAAAGAAGEGGEGAEPDPLELTRAAIGSFIRHVTDDPRRARVLFVEGLGNEAMGRRRLAAMRGLAEMIGADVAEAQGTGPLDPIVPIAANLLVGGMAELLIIWLHGGLDVPIEQFIDDASALFVATGAAAEAIARGREPTTSGDQEPGDQEPGDQ
jgi:AcrR family transcriptional regulator